MWRTLYAFEISLHQKCNFHGLKGNAELLGAIASGQIADGTGY